LLDLVRDRGPLVEGLVAVALDRAEVDEDVVPAARLRDEPVALVGVEPLNGSGCHVHTSSNPRRERAAGGVERRTGTRSSVLDGPDGSRTRRMSAGTQVGTTKNAIAAYWNATAAITSTWKSSWYPNTAGRGFGNLNA